MIGTGAGTLVLGTVASISEPLMARPGVVGVCATGRSSREKRYAHEGGGGRMRFHDIHLLFRRTLPVPRLPERRLGLVEAIGPLPFGPSSGARSYSITSSARSRIDGGIASPSALAVFRFRTISNLVGNCTGRSPGFSPRRMRST